MALGIEVSQAECIVISRLVTLGTEASQPEGIEISGQWHLVQRPVSRSVQRLVGR